MADSEDHKKRDSLWGRLRNGTVLGSFTARPRVPESVMNAMRYLAEEPDTDDSPGTNPYERAKQRFNRIWAGRDAYAGAEGDISPVSKFKTLRGALTAFWTGEKWAQAWASTGATLGVAALNAKNTVWISVASADFVNSIAQLTLTRDPAVDVSLQPLLQSGMALGGFGALYIAGYAVQDYLKLDLQRRMTGWMTSKFNEAVLDKPDTIYRMTHNRDENSTAPDAMPEGPHQRMSDAVSQAVRQFTNFGVGAWGAVLTSGFVAAALYNTSAPVKFLDDMGHFLNEKFPNGMIDFVPGDAGTFALAMTTVAAYSAVMFPLALHLGKNLEKTGADIQKAGAAHSETLVSMFSRGQALAESGGNIAQKKILDKVYENVDKAWLRDNLAMTKYMTYNFFQGFMGYNLVSVIPGLAGALSQTVNFKQFMETQLYTGAMMQSVGYFFNMIPSIKSMQSAVSRINGMATMIDMVQDRKKFYELSGRHDFNFDVITDADSPDIIRVKDMALYHRGEDAPFVEIDDVVIKKGDQVFVEGHSGCGKSSWFRAVVGKFPYGRGDISMADDTSMFFARQKADIDPHLTLAEHVVYGAESNVLDFTPDPARIAWALDTAGLAHFSRNADKLTHEGKSWPEILSGGQEQRLVLARILYRQPDLLLLDEATKALHPAAQREFFQILRTHCPQATVLAIMHTDGAASDFAYNKKLCFVDGGARMQDATPHPRMAQGQQPRTLHI